MSILRSGALVALNDLYKACDKSANHMQAAADASAEHPDLARALGGLARARFDWAKSISAAIKQADDIPSAVTGEAKLIDTALTGLQAVFSDDELRTLLDGCAEADKRIAGSAAAALEEELEPPLRELLEEILDRSSSDTSTLRKRFAGPSADRL